MASAQAHTSNSLDPHSASSDADRSARQLVTWLDGRNASSFGNLGWSEGPVHLHGGGGDGRERIDGDGADRVGGQSR